LEGYPSTLEIKISYLTKLIGMYFYV